MVVSTDLFYDGPRGIGAALAGRRAVAVEMEAATLFALAARRGFEAGALLIVSDLLLPRPAADRARGAAGRRAATRGAGGRGVVPAP